eukprot:Lithocolla_globosa_v1_NODE_366_length_4288_cov_54.588944.p1 type:complete len:700 gc:universal NODE_366_length_4288_cov_54.588944:3111-1012(-)
MFGSVRLARVKKQVDRSDTEVYRWHFLEMRREDLHKLGMELGKVKFGDSFFVSETIFNQLEPFQIHKPGRSTALCRYHLQFHYFVLGLFFFLKKLRDHKILTCDCENTNIKCSYAMRKYLVCERPVGVGIDRFYDGRDCVNRTCSNCGPGLKQLKICEHVKEIEGRWSEVTFQRWQKVEYRSKDGTDKDRYDFKKVTLEFSEFFDEFSSCFDTFLMHHDLARWLDDDYEVQTRVTPGFGACTQDPSENYTHDHKEEHTSRYFDKICSSIYPMVLELHLDDVTNIDPEEKAKLRKLFDAHGLPHVITEAHIVVSPDLNHNVATIIHANEKILEPYLEAYVPSLHTLHDRSDGCRNQYKQAKFFLWLSRRSAEGCICRDWSFFCSCHGKAKSDPVGGGVKTHAKRRELESTPDHPTMMKNSWELFQYLQETYTTPKQTLYQKKGKGIYRRFFHYVPQTGKGSVNYRIRDCERLDGSSKLHQLRDIGIGGRLMVRERSCHHCESCWSGDWEDCRHVSIVGEPKEVVLSQASDLAVRTRSSLKRVELEIAQIKSDNIFAVALDSQNEPWMLCAATAKARKVKEDFSESGVRYIKNDLIIDVRKLEPINPGSMIFEKTDKQFIVFAADVILTGIELEQVTGTISRLRRACAALTVSGGGCLWTTKKKFCGTKTLKLIPPIDPSGRRLYFELSPDPFPALDRQIE